mgnify:CR=1 FL=1
MKAWLKWTLLALFLALLAVLQFVPGPGGDGPVDPGAGSPDTPDAG